MGLLKWTDRAALAIAGFLAGAALVFLWQPSLRLAEVRVSNASGKAIVEVSIDHTQGTVRLPDLADGATRTVGLYSPGESGYRLRVRFDDGSVVEGGGGYLEAGYMMSQVIRADRIDGSYEALR